jgi:PHS family inorganic phosphate transporter-like MFS transporter
VASGVVAIIAVAGFKSQILSESLDNLKGVDQAWRVIIGLGCVPAFIALYFRLTITETPRYTIDVEADVQQGAKDAMLVKGQVENQTVVKEEATLPKHSFKDFCHHFGQWKNFKVLFGAAWSWFALDVAFYGLGLNSSKILQTIGFGSYAGSSNASENIQISLYNVAVGNLILAVGGLLPGYYFSMAFIDSWGRKPIQVSRVTIELTGSSWALQSSPSSLFAWALATTPCSRPTRAAKHSSFS